MLKLMATDAGVKRMVDQAFLIRAFQGYLFRDLPEEVLWRLVGQATLERLDADQPVFREGDPGDAFYLIRNGQVKISKASGGKDLVLSYLVAGNFFGETALLPGTPRTATVTTIFPTELIRLGRDDFERFLEDHPHLREGIVGKLEERRIASLIAEAAPLAGSVLSDLIREEVVMGTQALFIDDHKCVRCGNCIAACEGVHEDGQARLSLTGIKFYNLLAPNSCWQCENPLCMTDCPPDAIARDPHGEVYIKSNCIGCGNCEKNCPYDNIFMVHPKAGWNPFDWVKGLLGFEGGGKGGEAKGGRRPNRGGQVRSLPRDPRRSGVRAELSHGGGDPAGAGAVPGAPRRAAGAEPGDLMLLRTAESARWRRRAFWVFLLLVASYVYYDRRTGFTHGGSQGESPTAPWAPWRSSSSSTSGCASGRTAAPGGRWRGGSSATSTWGCWRRCSSSSIPASASTTRWRSRPSPSS